MSGRGVALYVDTRDWWIGYYRGQHNHYVCPLPTVVIRWARRGPAARGSSDG